MNRHARVWLNPILLALALALPVAALADDGPSRGRGHDSRGHQGRGGGRSRAPEFDPTTVGAIAAVIAGGTVLIARRRKS